MQTDKKVHLWNPKAAANWSFLFTPLFGAWIQAKNWRELEQNDKSKQSMYWAYATFFLLIITLIIPLYIPVTGIWVSLCLAIFFYLGWYFGFAQKQIKYISENQIQYVKKSWKKPVIIAIGISFLYNMVAGIISSIIILQTQAYLLRDIELHSNKIQQAEDSDIKTTSYVNNSLSCDIAQNLTFSGINLKPITLEEGKWESPPAIPNMPSTRTIVELDKDLCFQGDFNNDNSEDLIVILYEHEASAPLYIPYIAGIESKNGEYVNTVTASLSSLGTINITTGEIENDGTLVLNLLTRGPNDPQCCPSQKSVLRLKYINGQFVSYK